MNPFEMVVLIVAIVMIAGVLRARYKSVEQGSAAQPDPDAIRLREEVRQLKERVATLERIATDSSSSLHREIEALRERP